MNRNSKKGFTIVELIIVIAVIAVLAAVLIPTFSNLIQKANVAADQTLIKNLNTALAMDTTVSKHETMTQALEATKANGFDVEKIVARATKNRIVWDSVNDCFAYIEEGKSEPTYIPDTKTEANVADYQLWTIVDSTTLDTNYSSYIAGTNVTGAVVAAKGVDVGENTGITAIRYENSSSMQKVVIVTNSFDTTLTIYAANDEVKHFGDVKEVDIAKIAMSSYHEFGTVSGNINLAYGNVELENGSSVANIVVKSVEDVSPSTGTVKVAVASGANANLIISENDGVTVTVEGSGASTVSKLENITGKVAAIGSKSYSTLKEAWDEVKDGDTIVLLADCTTSSTLLLPENTSVTVDMNKHEIKSTARVFTISNKNSELVVKGDGNISTSEQVVFSMTGSATDDGSLYNLNVGHDIKISSTAYGIAIFEKAKSASSFGVNVVFKGVDNSSYGAVYINGTVKTKVGNIPTIKLENAICNSAVYLAGFSKFTASNCVFNSTGSLNLKSGDIRMEGNTINIDCSKMNKQEADYIYNGNGAFAGKCGILFENGVPGYAGFSAINISANNVFNFSNKGNLEYYDAIYIDYTQDTSYDIQIKVNYLDINSFSSKIKYSGMIGNETCGGYIYFVSEAAAKSYTKEKFMEQYGVTSISSFGEVEKVEK